MTEDELDRMLRAARPHTGADAGWDGSGLLARIHHALPTRERNARRPLIGRLAIRAALAAAVAGAVTAGLLTGSAGDRPAQHQAIRPAPPPAKQLLTGPVPSNIELVAYSDCTAMLHDLRAHTAAHVTQYGLGVPGSVYDSTIPAGAKGIASVALPALGPQANALDHSTTNVQEQGVGEPDIVETDGRRIVTVTDGVLRVIDVATHRVTGQLDLSVYSGASAAQLLMSGNRALVLLGSPTPILYGPVALPASGAMPIGAGTTALLVDLSSATPKIVDTFHTDGGYVDARMVGNTVRVVVRSAPHIAFPAPNLSPDGSANEAIAANQRAVNSAPLRAWLPSFDVTTGASTVHHTVPCQDVSHPKSYTGTSMLSVYTFDLAGSLANPQPVTLAADGATVYATESDLYVASSAGNNTTQLHRFAIDGTAKPAYLGSGSVPGQLFDSYSMSEYDGALRVVTTRASGTDVYVLDAATLKIEGHVGGLGPGEQLHGVRFLGPLGYVVTFRSVDPLYVLDLRDPKHPRKAGELTVTGYSDYLHPVGDGRLLGVGQDVNANELVTGAQVSLFDVSSPTHPRRLARVVRSNTPSETPIDPHAFLFWPATGTAVVPIDSWTTDQSGAALVVHVGDDSLTTVGTIENPGAGSGIMRTVVIGDELWTLSSAGLRASDLQTLHQQAWVAFST